MHHSGFYGGVALISRPAIALHHTNVIEFMRHQSMALTSLTTAEIARDADETDIQGQSRPAVVVPIDAAYTTSYQH